MKKRLIFVIAFFCICIFRIIEIKAQEISYVKTKKADNTFNGFYQDKKYIFEQSDALIAANNQSSFLSRNPFLVLQPSIPDFQVNDDEGNSDQKFPAIAIDCSGNFMITWIDKRDEYYGIYVQYLFNDGSAPGSNLKVTDSLGIVYHYCAPSIAADSAGNCVIAWMDGRDGFKNIYMQRFSRGGIKIGDNFKVNDEEQRHSKEHPSAAMDKEGNFIITWSCCYYGDRVRDIYAQRFSSDGNPLEQTFKVSDYLKYADHEHPAITIDGKGNFIITWCEAGDSNKEIYAQLFSSDGRPIGNNFTVNDDGTYRRQQAPDIAADDSGNFVIVWQDSRYASPDIFAQRYNCDGTPIDINFKVNNDESAALQYYPAISMNKKGNFIISWYDNRNGDYDVYAQRYLSDGSAFGTNFQVNINSDELQELPDIALCDNKVYNVWQDNHTGVSGYDIWANVMLFNSPPQWISSNMATAYEDSSFEYHARAIDPEGFAICYAFQDYPGWCTFADSIIYGTPAEGAKDTSLVVIASDGQISDTLEVVITVIPINDPPQIINLSEFHLKNNEPYIINLDTCVYDADNLPEDMTWKVKPLDNRLRADVVNHAAIFSAPNWTGETDVLFKVTDLEGESDSNIVKVTVIGPSSIHEKDQLVPEKFCLEQNYPNPFNPQTNISFGLPRPSEVTIDIFNLRGELVTTILKSRKEAGYHTVVWDGTFYPSGTYFIKMQAGDFVQIKKGVLLK